MRKLEVKGSKLVYGQEQPFQVMIKGSMQLEEITIIDAYAPRYVNQILTCLNGTIDSNTVIERGINSPIVLKNVSTRQNLTNELAGLTKAGEH